MDLGMGVGSVWNASLRHEWRWGYYETPQVSLCLAAGQESLSLVEEGQKPHALDVLYMHYIW